MYRYTGDDSVVNNYVCLGECDADGNNKYRIIGITSTSNSTLGLDANQVKLIHSKIIANHAWDADMHGNVSWEASDMYEYLQGTDILGNTTYIPSGWSNYIDNVYWYNGDVTPTETSSGSTDSTNIENASLVVSYEKKSKTSAMAQIGLLYFSDYSYSAITGGTMNCTWEDCSGWLNLTSSYWTMARSAYHVGGDTYWGWYVSTYNNITDFRKTSTLGVRPVFYLTTLVNYVSGTGKEDDPYVIDTHISHSGGSGN